MPSHRLAVLAPAALVIVGASLAAVQPSQLPVPPRAAEITDSRLHGIGRLIANQPVKIFDGTTIDLHDLRGETATVLAMFDLACPLSAKWRPELSRIEDEFEARGVRFVFVDATGLDTADDVRAEAERLVLSGPVIDDGEQTLAKSLDAESTCDVFVLDAANTLVYRGAIDDQYGLASTKPQATSHYLRDALDSVVSNSRIAIPATAAPGCAVDLRDVELSESPITYHDRVSRIIAQNCMTCHRDGGVAPFALDDLESVSRRAGMIRYVVDEGLMPPWPAAPTEAAHVGFANDRSLSDEDRRDLLAWIDDGKPEGDPADAPLPPKFADVGEWNIGTPDAVFRLPRPQRVQADGFMDYRYLRVPTNFADDRWIKAMQIKPTAPEVVHHVLVFAVPPEDLANTPDAKYRLRQRFRTEAGYFAAYVPGNDHVIFPDGLARKIAAGSEIIFQVHYTPNGTATTDQTEIGLIFADAPPEREVQVFGIVDNRLNIPPGEGDHAEGTSLDIPRDIHLLSLMPHMHLRGKSFKYTLTTPDGETQTLLDVPAWDFNWQLAYRLAKPLAIQKGSRINVSAVYDNSQSNPFNPDPSARVRWGDQTNDEMLIGYIEYTRDDETLPPPVDDD